MAQYVSTKIDIEGRAIKEFSSLSLSQGISEHHHFRLVCPTEAIDGTSGSVLNMSKNLVGAKITVEVAAVESAGALQFSGLVTGVEASRHSSHAGDVIITGLSPTVLLDSGSHCKTWEKKAVKNIAQDVVKHFPENLLKPAISPINGQTLSYTVQYKETAWQFLARLAATYGEWFFYDGQRLVLGTPQGEKAKLIYGSTLEHFTMSLQMQPARFQIMAYDYMKSEVYDGTPSGIADKAGLNDWGKHVLQKSEQFYASQPKQWHNQFLTNKKQLDDFINTRAAVQSSGMVRFRGSSGHPGLQIGGSVNVQGKNVFSGSEEAFGDYTVISLNHYCDGLGHYSNDFEAIPASVKMPPVTVYHEPHCETQSAFVTDNHDPKGLGRIRVKFHWMNGTEKSPWLRVTSPHGGGGKGMFFIPEVGEEVIVGFEGDSAVKPYIIGTVYHGKAKNDFSNSGNDVKALQTRSGNRVIMNDKDGSITIADPSGNTVVMHGNGEVTIHAPKKMTITSPDIIVAAENSIQILVGGSKEAPAPTVSLVMDNADQSAAMMAKQTLSLTSNQDMTFDGTETLTATTQDLAINGTATAVINAGQLNIDGGSCAKISSADTDIF